MWYNVGMSFIERNWRTLLFGIIGGIVGIVFLEMLQGDEKLATAFVAFGTLILAIVTAMTIDAGRAREKRDKEERLLNEIVEWALEATKTAIFRQTIISHELRNTRLKYKYSISRGKYIERIVLSSFPSLLSLFKSTLSVLDRALLITQKFAERNTDKMDLLDCEEQVAASVERLIKEAARIKTKDIGKKEQNMSKEGEATVSKEPTMKDIEEHLLRQDKEIAKGAYFSGYIFGATLVFIAFGLLAGKYILTTELSLVTYSIVMLIGGTVLMGFAWYKRH